MSLPAISSHLLCCAHDALPFVLTLLVRPLLLYWERCFTVEPPLVQGWQEGDGCMLCSPLASLPWNSMTVELYKSIDGPRFYSYSSQPLSSTSPSVKKCARLTESSRHRFLRKKAPSMISLLLEVSIHSHPLVDNNISSK